MAGEDVWFHNFSYSSRYKVNVFHQRLWVGDHSMIAGGVAGPET